MNLSTTRNACSLESTEDTEEERKISNKHKERSIHWRELFKKALKKYGEAGLMLKGCRYKEKLTQKELADAIGVSQHHISEMESGKRPIGKLMAMRFAKFFKTDYRKFL